MSIILDSLQIRWSIKSDYAHLSLIDRKSFGHNNYWSADKFQRVRDKLKNSVVLTCEIQDDICGYCVYKIYSNKFKIIRMAVDSRYRNYGIGQEIIDRMRERLTNGRNRIEVSSPYESAGWFHNVCFFDIESHDSKRSLVNLYFERWIAQ